MRQLKYIKLFEAFESIKLTKILGYINQESRRGFIQKLESISRQYDFPMSNFSDDMFQYLSFKKALNVKLEEKTEPCKATSKNLFGSSGLDGEVCQSGKIKRMWGSRQRIVDCSRCGGTGNEPQRPELKIIKFWFTSDGKFVTNTGVDGKIRETYHKIDSKILSEYDVVDTIESTSSGVGRLREIPHLSKVFFKGKRSDSGEISTIYIDGRDVFSIQNKYDGGTPSGRDWRTHGRYSWNISGGDFHIIKTLKPKEDKEEAAPSVDPYTWNVSLSSRLSVSESGNVQNEIKDAHFALVLDISKLKSGDYTRASDIRDEREELKSGSKLVMTDDKVRTQNIQRYIALIANKADITGDISNIKNLVNRGLGGRWALFVLESQARYQNNFSAISELYYNMMMSSEEDKQHYIKSINERIKNIYSKSSDVTTKISRNITEIKKNLVKENQSDRYLPIVEGLERISFKFYNKLMSGQFETIEDLEIARQKMISLSSFFNNSVYSLDNLSNFIDYLTYDDWRRSYSYLVGTWRVDDYYDRIIRGIEIVEKLVDRL